MQGRLLPKYQGRYQAHPKGYWKDEFKIASSIGLDCIEFILDYNDAACNPLLTEYGIDEIIEACNQTSVSVKTICADYFMEAPLHSDNMEVSKQSQKILIRLIDHAEKLGVTDIVIPCVDQSSLNSKQKIDFFVEKLSPMLKLAEEKEINLSLETDLAPKTFLELLDRFHSTRVTVNYDTGNSAALGFNVVEELDTYGYRITDIHIKDRSFGGGPVELGFGNADFSAFFIKLKEFNYTGAFIMQAYRDKEGVAIFKQQLNWILKQIEAFYES